MDGGSGWEGESCRVSAASPWGSPYTLRIREVKEFVWGHTACSCQGPGFPPGPSLKGQHVGGVVDPVVA